MAERKLELLSPAKDALTAIEAVRHGADAVYMGPPNHGARKSASNSLDDISRAVEFAHTFGARVYCTVNTIIYEKELRQVERMIRDLYRIGVDALIVQDMGILRMDIPPIELHASTQCDIRTPEKARFLQEAGFSQLVLARELSLEEIRAVCRAVTVPVEVFVHGALCTSFSGRCQAGYAAAGRSGNRGECPQICRLPFTLRDASGRILAKDKYLLSLKDFNASARMPELIEAGVSSFKIEGRLKEPGYVKNVTASYSRRLNEIIARSRGQLSRSSFGEVKYTFTPQLDKSFNRGFTDYRLSGQVDPKGISATDTPKSKGELIRDISSLNPGDGISFFNSRGEYDGVIVNGISGGVIKGNRPFILPKGAEIRRTSDIKWKKLMDAPSAERKLLLDITLDQTGVSARDESGSFVRLPLGAVPEKSEKSADYRKVFSKLGATPFTLREFHNRLEGFFVPLSHLTALRRNLVEALLEQKKAAYPFRYRGKENKDFPYPLASLDYRDNVSNSLAENFYRDHRVTEIEPALEVLGRDRSRGKRVMTTRHCILRDLGCCLKREGGEGKIKMPLSIENGNLKYRLDFDCGRCEMHLTAL